MSILAYIWGVALLAGSLGALGLGAGAVARTWFADWRGPVGLLARLALALSWVYAVSYGLGAVGLFRPIPLLLAVDGGALAAWLLLRRRATGPEPAPETRGGPRTSGASSLVAGVGVALVVAAWLPGTAHAYRFGILEPDSLWYHGHFSTRFVQTGWLTRINPVGVDALVPFHLANRELLDALLVLPWHRDLALPLTNLIYLGLLLLAAWCIGARWQRGPLALLAGALIASAPVMVLSHPGSLKNDLLATALLLAAVALFVHSEGRLPHVALAGATLGLAAGTKSNVLVVVVATLVAGVAFLVRRERSGWAPPLAWVGATVAFGAYWYLRNWIRAGNPLPWVDLDLGPLHLDRIPAADGSEDYADQTLLDHLDHPRLLDDVVRPGLEGAFGELWWAWPALLVLAIGLVAARGRDGWLRTMVGIGLLGLLAHLATPLSLVIPPDEPGASFNFAFNTRYALPALALALVAGACATGSRRTELLVGLATLVVIVSGLFPTGLSTGASHDAEASDVKVTVALGLAVAIVAAAVLLGRSWLVARRTQVPVPALGVGVPVLAALLAFPLVDRYLDQRYTTPMARLASGLWPTTSQLEDAHVGIATDPKPYPHAGTDLSNRVDYVGMPRRGGVLRNAASCEEWVARVRDLDLTHIALAPEPFVMLLSGETLERWSLAVPGAEVLTRDGDQVLIALPSDPPPTAPGACPQA